MTGGSARTAVGLRFELDLVLPIPVGDKLADMSRTLAGVNRMARPAGPPLARLADVHVMEVQIAVPELCKSPALLGCDQLASMACETQLVVLRVERGVKQIRIGLRQEIGMG